MVDIDIQIVASAYQLGEELVNHKLEAVDKDLVLGIEVGGKVNKMIVYDPVGEIEGTAMGLEMWLLVERMVVSVIVDV